MPALARASGFAPTERLPRPAAQFVSDIHFGGKVRVSATLLGGVFDGKGGQLRGATCEVSSKTYACPAFLVDTRVAALDGGAPGWMRSPGTSVGQFTLKLAIDELAEAASLDPLDLRLFNHADTVPGSGKQWSSESLRACYAAAAERIGWHARDPAADAMHDGAKLFCYGMAVAAYPVKQMPRRRGMYARLRRRAGRGGHSRNRAGRVYRPVADRGGGARPAAGRSDAALGRYKLHVRLGGEIVDDAQPRGGDQQGSGGEQSQADDRALIHANQR